MKLQAQQLSLRFGDKAVVEQVDITLRPGELLGLIGPNGAGKTSLLRMLAGLQTPDHGSVTLDGQALHAIPRQQLARQLGYLAQGAPAHWPLKVKRLVELGRLPHQPLWQRISGSDQQAVAQAMREAEVEHLADRVVSTLSGGERLRVMLARLFATQPSIILADEPIAALDPYHQLHTMELLRQHCDRGGAAAVVLHDLSMAARFCQRLVLMHGGAVAADGEPAHVLSDDHLRNVYGIAAKRVCDEEGVAVVPNRRVQDQHPE